ncbi:MAG: hypothetical protein IJN58_06030 [Clostridia bacterium]|nr:hypothetical protein [Clostridia bacterium]
MASTAKQKIWDFYNIKPGAPIFKKEFGYYVLDRWIGEGYLKPRSEVADYDKYLRELFDYDEPMVHNLGGLGWCEAAFIPAFEEKILEDRGDCELVQDYAGRALLCFKGRRQGFMPEYVDHPVKDMKTFEENVKWRLAVEAPGRMAGEAKAALAAKAAREDGKVVVQQTIGGYMYLRSLIGPEDLLYAFYDDPELIHACMKAWLELADAVVAEHQKVVDLDELFLAEDICYNGGCLISPDMMREFLFPYYQQLIENTRKRNGGRVLHIQIDTDGRADDVIDLYRGVGMDYMSPFEVAAGCDIVGMSQKYPDLRLSGGIDKRKIAEGGDAIKRHLEAILPPLRKRGGFIPTCDHGVPEETSFENYMLYRKLMKEYCD